MDRLIEWGSKSNPRMLVVIVGMWSCALLVVVCLVAALLRLVGAA